MQTPEQVNRAISIRLIEYLDADASAGRPSVHQRPIDHDHGDFRITATQHATPPVLRRRRLLDDYIARELWIPGEDGLIPAILRARTLDHVRVLRIRSVEHNPVARQVAWRDAELERAAG